MMQALIQSAIQLYVQRRSCLYPFDIRSPSTCVSAARQPRCVIVGPRHRYGTQAVPYPNLAATSHHILIRLTSACPGGGRGGLGGLGGGGVYVISQMMIMIMRKSVMMMHHISSLLRLARRVIVNRIRFDLSSPEFAPASVERVCAMVCRCVSRSAMML